jgi:uncharacterized membrane protein YdjX (TVP38/TMEM64 family)
MRRAAWLPRALLVVAIAGGVIWAILNRRHLDPGAVDEWLATFGALAPLAHVLAYAVGAVVFLPGSVFALAGGALFGPFWGTAFNLLGATTGATIAFLVARYVARDWVAERIGEGLKRLIAGVDAEGWRFVAFVRLVPLFPFTLTNYALGVSRIGLLPYVAATLTCMLPGAVAYTWLGHAGRGALAGDVAAIRFAPMALGALAIIVFGSRILARHRRQQLTP